MDDFYREMIVDRFQHPQFRGKLDPCDITFEDTNPLCGDEIRIDLRVDDQGKVTEAVFDGRGCAISQVSADLLMETLQGKSMEEIKKMTKEDILELLGIELSPVRLKCALLSLKVLKAAVYGLKEADDELVE